MQRGARNAPGSRARAATWRVFLLALFLIPLNCYWVQQLEIVWYSAQPTTISLYFHVVFTLVALMALNAGIRRLWPRLALSRGELLVLYIMLAISTSLAGHDQLEILVPIMAHGTWFATPENKWNTLFGDYIPSHLVVNQKSVLAPFYEGDSTLYTPRFLKAWAAPVGMWMIFIGLLLLTGLCLCVIFRRQWTEREKLSYPIAQIPLELTAPEHALWKSWRLWLGFGIAAAIDCVNGLNFFYPNLPYLAVRADWGRNIGRLFTRWPWSVWGGTQMTFYPFAIGLGYLLPLDMLFSSWFFYWFWQFQRLTNAYMGWGDVPRSPYVTEQSFGGFMGLLIFALWVGRSHLAAVVRKAIKGDPRVEDSREPIAYRWAVLGAAAGMAGMIIFGWRAGMPLWASVAFFLILIALLLSVTRMRAELGPPAHDLHWGGPDEMIPAVLGTQAIGPRGLTAFSLFEWMTRAFRSHPLPHTLEGFRIGERAGLDGRGLFYAMAFAGVLGALSGFWGMLHIGYSYGMGSAKIRGPGLIFGREPYERLASWLEKPRTPSVGSATAIGVGIAFSLSMLAIRSTFPKWPFHPVGYAVSSSWSMNLLWMPMFIAWVVKGLILRYGGLRLFRLWLPFFLGLILGEYVTGSIWSLGGILTGRNTYVFWPY